MIPFPQLVDYRAPLDTLLAELVAELSEDQPLVVGERPLRVVDVYHVGKAAHDGLLPRRSVSIADDSEGARRVAASVAKLNDWLTEHRVIYGVNTGYGGTGVFNKSLDSQGLERIQQVLINGLLASAKQDHLPPEVVRASMLVRVASGFVGVSGLRLEVMRRIVQLINEDVVPVVPMKGSLTASGDLVPLAYIAAALDSQDDPRVEVFFRGRRMSARQACEQLGLSPIRLAPKEALALVNGTSVAAAAGCLVAVGALNAFYLTAVLTAFAHTVVRGSLQCFHPFIAEVKPHLGQRYASRLIFNLLHSVDDELLPKNDLTDFAPATEHRLWQLTYPFRCASQHLAPEYDVLMGTFHDLGIEINSVSDNPLVLNGRDHQLAVSGGNFLGATIGRDMDKLKVSLHSLARLAHAQFKYLVRGVDSIVAKTETQSIQQRVLATHLIPLSAHPSDSMGFQGVEIYMDALLSEMNVKVGPHSSTYLAAEKENQAIVAMGLAAARAADDICRDLNYCLAAHLLALCQAFDLTTLDPEEIRRYEQAEENVVPNNARAEQLGMLRPLYDFVRQQCGIPAMFTSTRLHAYLEPLVQKIESLELLRFIHEPTVRRACEASYYEQYAHQMPGLSPPEPPGA